VNKIDALENPEVAASAAAQVYSYTTIHVNLTSCQRARHCGPMTL